MDDLNIGVSDLAKKLDRRPSYLSHVRSGDVNPPINKFWLMVEAMEEIKPGAKAYFGQLISDRKKDDSVVNFIRDLETAELARLITDAQLAGLLHLVGNRIVEKDKNKSAKLSTESDIVIVG